MDGRVVPRPAPRAAAGLAGGRSRPAQGRRGLLRRRGDRRAQLRRALRSLPEPLGALPADGTESARVSVRTATEADVEAIRRLYREFFPEWPAPPYYGADIEEEL